MLLFYFCSCERLIRPFGENERKNNKSDAIDFTILCVSDMGNEHMFYLYY